jgi:uncharacterized membrane protein YbjE (DUF340 family)
MLFTTFAAILLGLIIGFTAKAFFTVHQKILNKIGSGLLFLMLFLLGINLSNHEDLMKNFSSIFVLSLILAICSSLGSVLTNKFLNKLLNNL